MKPWLILIILVAVLAIPFLLRPKQALTAAPDHTLVIISPHNEAIRDEFTRAFQAHIRKTKNQQVAIDWRTPGGTTEIARYIESEYLAAFSHYYQTKLGKSFGIEEKGAFANSEIIPSNNPAKDTSQQAARRAFLDSNVSSRIDLMFGGGSFDFAQQAAKGNLVDCGLLARHPEWFDPNRADNIPRERGGEIYYDKQGRWFGACLSGFGICYNTDSLKRLHINPPQNWSDLANPKYLPQLALADPTQSGSITKAFEMIIQQQIQEAPDQNIELGWQNALQLLQKFAANSRYFTDSAAKIPLDVSSGDAAAGLCIDFYGRFQSEAIRQADGSSRLIYLSPPDGTSIGADPIGLLRGAPHPELAKDFIDFVLSEEGQKLWDFKNNTPGGPIKYQLRRLPIRPELYAKKYRAYRTDPDVLPYSSECSFSYNPAWTSSLFRPIGFIIRAMCIDPHDELQSAWVALIKAGFPPEATRVFCDVSKVDYAAAKGEIKTILNSPDKIDQVRLANTLSQHFRDQYLKAKSLARAGK